MLTLTRVKLRPFCLSVGLRCQDRDGPTVALAAEEKPLMPEAMVKKIESKATVVDRRLKPPPR